MHSSSKLPNTDAWHGAKLSIVIEGNWSSYRAKVLKYLRQIAVITPYAQFTFNYIAEDPRSSLKLLFRRRTDVMPPPPKVWRMGGGGGCRQREYLDTCKLTNTWRQGGGGGSM